MRFVYEPQMSPHNFLVSYDLLTLVTHKEVIPNLWIAVKGTVFTEQFRVIIRYRILFKEVNPFFERWYTFVYS